MCKHILNVQVSIKAACCGKFFDCPECHAEQEPNHEWRLDTIVTFACKRCLKSFQKDMSAFEEADEFCPHCNNRFVIDAELADDLEAEQALAEVEASKA